MSNQYAIQFPGVPLFADWYRLNGGTGSLAEITGSVAPAGEVWLPGGAALAEKYGAIIDSLDFPVAAGVTAERKQSTFKTYLASSAGLDNAVKSLRSKLGEERSRRRLNDGELQEWWKSNSAALERAVAVYRASIADLDQITDPNWFARTPTLSYRTARALAAINREAPGTFSFDGSTPTLRAIVENGRLSEEQGKCPTTWTMEVRASARESSSQRASTRGSFGSFFKFSKTSGRSTDLKIDVGGRVAMGFCAESLVAIRPGGWFNSSLLDLRAGGQLKTNKVVAGIPVVDESGSISIPVGVIVGFRPRIEIKSNGAFRRALVDSWRSGEALTFGPIHVPAGGPRRPDSVEERPDGSVLLKAPGEDPYILAILQRRY